MQLCFRSRKGLGRDSELFFALHHQKISRGDDSGLKILECSLLWKGSSVEQLLGKLCHTSSPAALRAFWWKQKSLMPLKSMISLWALRQAPWEQEGSQAVKEAARQYETGWRYRLISRNQQAEEERLCFIFSSSSHNNPVRKTPGLGWVTFGCPVAQTNS